MLNSFLSKFTKKPNTRPLDESDTLRVGKTYFNRAGDPVRITTHRPTGGLYASFGFDYIADSGDRYLPNGRLGKNYEFEGDLVSVQV